MKNVRFLIIASSLLASGCVTVSYLGDRLTPTTKVDVFYSEHDVSRPFHVIGHLTCINSGIEYVKSQFASYGQKIGADAVVITGTQHVGEADNGLAEGEALKYN
jgi:hypothetical protein